MKRIQRIEPLGRFLECDLRIKGDSPGKTTFQGRIQAITYYRRKLVAVLETFVEQSPEGSCWRKANAPYYLNIKIRKVLPSHDEILSILADTGETVTLFPKGHRCAIPYEALEDGNVPFVPDT